MNKIIKYICTIILITLVGINNVYASSNYRISLSASSITKGNSVSLYIKGNELTGGFTISSSNTSVATVSSSTAWVENNTITITISALNSGSTTITVSPTTVSDDDGKDLNLSSKTLTLTVTEPAKPKQYEPVKKSSDATLKSLEIEKVILDKEFKSSVLEYKAEVDAGTEKVTIKAEPNDKKANISGTGEVTVKEGANKLEVIVAAEDGTTKTYTIVLTVKEYEPIIVKIGDIEYNVIRKKDELPEVELFEEKKITIKENEVDGYYNDKLKIYLIGLKDKNGNIGVYIYEPEDNTYKEYKWITIGGITIYIEEPKTKLKNFHKYTETIKNSKVDIYKINKKDNTGLIYGINVATGNKSYYIYDKEEETLARYYDKEINIYKKINEDYRKYILILAGATLVVLIVSLIVALTKSKKSKKSQ